MEKLWSKSLKKNSPGPVDLGMIFTHLTTALNNRPLVEQEYRSNWQPKSIRAPFLVFFICLCILFVISIEILLRTSKANGALKFGDVNGNLSLGSRFLFDYFPILVSVIFGLLWAISDHDFRRMEPYFQLSKLGGATAEDSLLLDYSYTLVLCLPYQGLKRR